jgi:hypothetical protein
MIISNQQGQSIEILKLILSKKAGNDVDEYPQGKKGAFLKEKAVLE